MSDNQLHRHDEIADLRTALAEGRLERREFLRRAVALGIAAPAAAWMLRAYGASAAPRSGSGALTRLQEEGNPITVTVGGTPIAVTEEDIANATPGGTLLFARGRDSENLDPVTNDGNVNIWVFMNIYDQLVRVTPDGINLEPGLAESWEISEDGITYTFKLRQGVMFSDGSPMKASDVIFSLIRAANDPNQTWTFTLVALQRDAEGKVQGITALDDNTVEIKLAYAYTPFLSDLAMFNCSIISEAFAKDNEARLVDECMGTGPFMLGEWKKGEYIQLAKNPNYWEAGLPLLDGVKISVVPDDNNRILQLQGGEIHAISDVPSARVPELKGDGNLKVYEFPSTFTQYITINTRNAPLNDLNARQALNHATDRQTLVDVVLFGSGIVATSFMPKGALYWNDELPVVEYNVDKAKEMLAASATPEGFSVKLTYEAGNAEFDQLGAVLKDMWSKIGVDLQLDPAEQGVVSDSYFNHKFEMMINAWTNDIVDPDELVAYGILPESSEAFQTGWSNEEAIALAREGALETDPAKRKEIYFRIQQIYYDEVPQLPLYHKPYVEVMVPAVHNFGHPPTGQWVWKKTWVDQ